MQSLGLSFSPSRAQPEAFVRDQGDAFDATDPLAAFHSEAEWPEEMPAPSPCVTRAVAASNPARSERHDGSYRWVAFLLAALTVVEAPFAMAWIRGRFAADINGTVYVESAPSGAEVWVNDRAVGRTPTRLSLARGAAEIELRHAGRARIVPLVVVPEEIIRLRVELADSDIGSVAPPRGVPHIPDGATDTAALQLLE